MILTEVLNGSDPVLKLTETVCSSQRSNSLVGLFLLFCWVRMVLMMFYAGKIRF